jgi:hypothetical protein
MSDLDKPEKRSRWEMRTRIAARIVEKLNHRFRWLLNLWLEGLALGRRELTSYVS